MTSPERPRAVRIGALLVVDLLLVVVVLYGLELYLRATDPVKRMPLPPAVRKNHYGFRDREFEVPKPTGVCRIAALGDSFTWGVGVWEEQRYATVLELYLNQRYPRKKFEVVTLAIPGAYTRWERDDLAMQKYRIDPDLVTVGFVLNDPKPHRQNYSPQRERYIESHSEAFQHFTDRARAVGLGHVGSLVPKAYDNFLVKIGVVPTWQETMRQAYEVDSGEWQDFVQSLSDIRRMSDEMSLPPPIFAVLDQGVYTDRPTDYASPDPELRQYLAWYDQAAATASELGFTAVDFRAELATELAGRILAANILDPHPSADMHRIYARKLLALVAEYIDAGRMCTADLAPAASGR
jgi:hypothetical protein